MEKLTGFNKGVNLGGWLSQCVHTKEHYDSFITRKDIENLSKWKVDHVRVPVDYNLVEDAEGNYLEEGSPEVNKDKRENATVLRCQYHRDKDEVCQVTNHDASG